ncbi:MAG: porin [Gammaproteobacteria bacterium]|nr:porin [Gammaproteobacteria bacterium]
MFKQLTLIVLLVISNAASAIGLNTNLYGKINISRDFLEERNNDWISNASRIGVKGNYPISETLRIVYQLEQELDPIHGGTTRDTLLSTRNSFVGFKSNMGRLIFGTHDSPLKMAQGKVDQFNDKLGDIRNGIVGEVRATDSYMYNSPRFGAGFQFNAMYVDSDSQFDSSQSYSLTYQRDNLYLAAAYDADMRKNNRSAAKTRVFDSYRAVAQYTLGNLKLGALFQSSDLQNIQGVKRQEAIIISGAYKYQSFTFRAQWSDSDIKVEDLQRLSLGADYRLNKRMKLYINGYHRKVKSDSLGAIEVGGEYKF